MTDTSQASEIDLQVLRSRNRAAQNIVAGFAAARPNLDYFWQYLATALDDALVLLTGLTAVRLSRANLLAAARASIAADHDGERDPLSYLRDELGAQEPQTLNAGGQA